MRVACRGKAAPVGRPAHAEAAPVGRLRDYPDGNFKDSIVVRRISYPVFQFQNGIQNFERGYQIKLHISTSHDWFCWFVYPFGSLCARFLFFETDNWGVKSTLSIQDEDGAKVVIEQNWIDDVEGEGAWFSLIGKLLLKKQLNVEGMRMGLGLAWKLAAAVSRSLAESVVRGGGSRRGGNPLSCAPSVTGVGGILGFAGKAVSKSKELVTEGGGMNQGSNAGPEVLVAKNSPPLQRRIRGIYISYMIKQVLPSQGTNVFLYVWSLEAELWGVRQGLLIAKEQAYAPLIVELDAAVVVHFLKNSMVNSHPCYTLVRDCLGFIQGDWIVELRHIFREGNWCADCLALLVHDGDYGVSFYEERPGQLLHLLHKDQVRIGTLRP
ncbi:hypothetical protein CCACVL1_14977 [Corchorus capsularis]|uniref:RNase H type-1 domain-containing protein n=1 Tax=Corchorus capsularis TaxID=210143 RepID=A0A1R3I4L8_COCAP|nr:hypothetical protein CCACVL1_14977 [Corchorus capsularis]